MNLFAHRRTDLTIGKTFQGVETPSQTRYVRYYDQILHKYQHSMPPNRWLKLKSILITSISSRNDFLLILNRFSLFEPIGVGNGDGSDLFFTVGNYDEQFGRFSNSNSCTVDKHIDLRRELTPKNANRSSSLDCTQSSGRIHHY